jgi:hypothetical protein
MIRFFLSDIVWPQHLPSQKGFRVTEIILEILLGDEDGELIEYFSQVVEINLTSALITQHIPGKQMNQYTKKYS